MWVAMRRWIARCCMKSINLSGADGGKLESEMGQEPGGLRLMVFTG